MAKEPRQCECGCGEMTKGGRFRPGHDAKLHSKQLREERGEVDEATQRQKRSERKQQTEEEKVESELEFWNNLPPLHGPDCRCVPCSMERLRAQSVIEPDEEEDE